MKTENLKVGMIIKNYESVCELLEIKAKSSTNTKGRNSHYEEFKRYFDYERNGQKYIITKIHKKAEEKIEKRGGNNKVFVDDFRNLMIYMLHKNRTESMLMSKGAMFKAMNLVNENYLLARNNIPKLSEIVEIPQESIYEFYDYNSSKLRDTLERNLKHCRSRSLLMYESVVSVAIQEVLIAYNELNQPILDSKGRVVSQSKLVYREATKEEKQIILRFENEVKKELGLKDNKEIFIKGKWKYFKQEVESRLKIAGTNIKFYYEAYKLTWNNDKIDSEYDLHCKDLKKIDIENNINSNMVESISKSIKNRHKKALENVDTEENTYKKQKYLKIINSNYIEEQEQLTFKLINENAESLKNEIEKPLDREKLNKINNKNSNKEENKHKDEQLELDWDYEEINSEVPF